jgi:subtilisin-like proprotein convertase family protein
MDGCMPDTEFASYFNQIAYKHRAVDMQQCHSGGFIDNLENTTTVISTAANCTESAYEADERDDCGGGVQVKYGEWNYWWMSAMEGHKPWPGFEPVDVDTNFDGKVSFLEAHNYALANDDRNEHPMWSDPGGIGDELSLVANWAGVHLSHLSHVIDDGGGNQDGVADAGEVATMPVTLHNLGEEAGTGISGTLSTDNPWVTVQDADASFPDLPAKGGSGESFPDHYQWSSHPDTPDDTAVRFRIDWTANGGAYGGNTQFVETVVRVILDVQQTSIEDGEGGNGDGIADPGESLGLAVTLRNRGHADARQVSGRLSTSSPWATVTDDHAEFEDVPAQASGRSLPPHFGIQIDPATPDKTWIDCDLEVSAADGYQFTLDLRFMVGSRGTVLLIEDGDGPDADMLEELIGQLGFAAVRELAPETDPATWLGYTMLVWSAGGNPDPVADPAWRNGLEQHVAEGGKLLIEGGDLGYEHRNNTSFRTNVLHMASWYAHGGGEPRVRENVHPIATVPTVLDPSIPLLGSGNADRDAVSATADARTILDWTLQSQRAAVIAYDDDDLQGNGGQVVSLFVACDVLDDSGGQRRSLMENAIEWLVGNDLPYLLYDGFQVDDVEHGNGDGIADPGETVSLVVDLLNEGSGTATEAWMHAESDRPSQVFLVDNFATAAADIPSAAVATTAAPHLVVRLGEDLPCGTVIAITLHITSAEGFSGARSFTLKVGTGGGQHVTYDATGLPLQIPNPGTADSVISVPEGFRVGDVNCRVHVQHSSTSLIRYDLRSPEGTVVVLHDHQNFGHDYETTYDTQTQPHGPGTMSDFDGEVGTGDWHLLVEDDVGDALLGALQSWSLIFDTDDLCHDRSCSEPLPAGIGNTLLLSKLSGSDIRLDWGTVPGAAGYNVWRSSHPEFGSPETVGSSAVNHLDEVGLPLNAEVYFYRVKAENACREEGP